MKNMPGYEENIANHQETNEKQKSPETITLSESLSDIIKNNNEELNTLIERDGFADSDLSGLDLAPDELTVTQESVKEIDAEILELKNDWQESAKDIALGSFNVERIKADAEKFGIKDFNIDNFKRIKLNEAGVAAQETGKSWDDIYNNSEFLEISYEPIVACLGRMRSLESTNPDSVKKLHEDFGITNFQRYPIEILLDQLQEPGPQKETGLLLFAEGDWNGAFDDQSEVWQKIYNQKKDALNFRIAECSSDTDLARQLIKTKQDFPNKIAFLTISAHSSPEGFYLADEDNGHNIVYKDNIKNNTESLKDIFAPNAQVIGNACSSGDINGWIRDLSKSVGAVGVGPGEPAGIYDVDFVGATNEVVPKYVKDDIYTRYYKGFPLSKKNKK